MKNHNHSKNKHCKCGKRIKTTNKRCIKCYREWIKIPENNNNYKHGKTHNNKCLICNKKISYKHGKCSSGLCKSCSRLEDKNPNWRKGISKLPYSFKFTKKFKAQIRTRDNHECQNCSMTEEEHLIVIGRNLDVHHIDYDKKNCKENNLISLCQQCNLRANANRDYWKEYYNNKIIKGKKQNE